MSDSQPDAVLHFREPLSRSGVELSLVIVRGSLQNLQNWVSDGDPLTGKILLQELQERLQAMEPVASDRGRWIELLAAFDAARASWPVGSPAVRLWTVVVVLEAVCQWLVSLEAARS